MMDAKRAIESSDGDMEAAKQWLREKGLAASAKRDERENTQGAVGLFLDGNVGAIVELKCETDFVASSERFKQLATDLATMVALHGEKATEERGKELEDLRITLKEKIELGDVVRIEAGDGDVLEAYLHIQGGRGVNAVLVQLAGGSKQLAHDIAVHIAFARPRYLSKDDVPADVVAHERQALHTISRSEGKPEAALPKIIEGRMTWFYKDPALLDQPYASKSKRSVPQ